MQVTSTQRAHERTRDESRGRRGGRASALLCALCLVGAWGCGGKGPKYQLEGSLSVVMDLGYDQVHVLKTDTEVSVRFVRGKGDGEDSVLKITASLSGVDLQPNQYLDLAENTPEGLQRGVVSRNVQDDPERVFPPLRRGQLWFKTALEPGTKTSGEVSVTFENGIDLASGRTVYGTFGADVQ